MKETNHFPSGQCTSLQVGFGNGKIKGFEIRNKEISTLFAWFDFPNIHLFPILLSFVDRIHLVHMTDDEYIADVPEAYFKDGIHLFD